MSAIKRRVFIAQIGAAVLLAAKAPAHASSGQAPVIARRPATIEWAAAETIMAIGGKTIATASPYRGQKGVTATFAGVPQIGSIFFPDLEDLQALGPDLIFCAGWQRSLVPMLSRIAPVHVFDLRNPSDEVFENAFRLTGEVGRLIGRESEAQVYRHTAEVRLAELRARLRPVSGQPVLLGTFEPDGRHVSVFGKGSLFDSVLTHLGLGNAWIGPMNAWGNASHGIEVLADYPATPFLYLDAGLPTAAARQALASSSLWNVLPSVRDGNVRSIPFEWLYGGLPTGLRFAESLAVALLPAGQDGRG